MSCIPSSSASKSVLRPTHKPEQFGEQEAHEGSKPQSRHRRGKSLVVVRQATGTHKAHQIPPVVTVLRGSQGTPINQTPHRAQDRFQPNAMLVDRPEINRRLWVGSSELTQERA
jgi:hypothetical protein